MLMSSLHDARSTTDDRGLTYTNRECAPGVLLCLYLYIALLLYMGVLRYLFFFSLDGVLATGLGLDIQGIYCSYGYSGCPRLLENAGLGRFPFFVIPHFGVSQLFRLPSPPCLHCLVPAHQSCRYIYSRAHAPPIHSSFVDEPISVWYCRLILVILMCFWLFGFWWAGELAGGVRCLL